MFKESLSDFLNPWVFVSIFVLVVTALISKRLFSFGRSNLEEEVLDKNNVAVASSFSGFLLGSYVVVGSSLVHPVKTSLDGWQALVLEFVYILFLLLMLRLFAFVFDLIFLRKMNFSEEMYIRNNTAAGVLEGFFFLSSAAVLTGANFGPSLGFLQDVLLVLLYSGLALVLIFFAVEIFERIFVDCVQEEVTSGNIAVAVAAGGFVLSVAVVTGYAISGPVMWDIFKDIFFTALYAVMGIVICLTSCAVIDVVVMSKNSFRNELKEPNIGIGIFMLSVFLATAIFFIYTSSVLGV